MKFYHLFLEHLNSILVPCYFKSITGLDCPGCGIQTAFLLLLKGDLVSSFFSYPALIPILISAGLYIGMKIKPRLVNDNFFKYAVLLSCLLIALNYGIKWYHLEVF